MHFPVMCGRISVAESKDASMKQGFEKSFPSTGSLPPDLYESQLILLKHSCFLKV